MVCEIAHAPRKIHITNWREHSDVPDAPEIIRPLLSDRPSIVLSGHFGNFELGGYLLGLFGFPTHTIARKLDNRYLDDFVNSFRGATGQYILPKDGSREQIAELLNNGGTLTLLGDQAAGDRACWVDFFGRPASTHKAVAVFSLSAEAPMLVTFVRRRGAPLHYTLGLAGVVDPPFGRFFARFCPRACAVVYKMLGRGYSKSTRAVLVASSPLERSTDKGSPSSNDPSERTQRCLNEHLFSSLRKSRLVSEFHFRTFHNSDPPHLATIWRSLPPQRGRVQPMTSALLEQCVFSKQHFDPNGVIVATQNNQPVGFAHAGFGPNDEGDSLENQIGVTYCVLLHRDIVADEAKALEDSLLERSEAYLTKNGAKVLYGGGIQPLNGFYLGLYGGSELPGVLDSDSDQQEIFLRNNYKAIDRVVVLHKDLATFKPTVSRQQRECNRRCEIEALPDPLTETWWEACTEGCFDRMAYQLTVKGTDKPAAVARFWVHGTDGDFVGAKSCRPRYA